MDTSIPRYCLSLLLLASIARGAGSNETNDEKPREPRVSGRIVKLYSGAKPEPFLCTSEGFQADPSNCAAFYRCVKERSGKFTVFRYQCAPGTVYDPDVETCNHPRSTRRSECGGMLKPTAEPHHTTNIDEVDRALSEVPRPIITKVPIYTEQTTLKNPTTTPWFLSTERQNVPSKTPLTSTIYSSPNTLSTSTSKMSESTTNNQWLYSTQLQWESQYTSKLPPKSKQPSNSKNTEPCTSDGFMGDSENCRKFYRCVGNQRGGYVKYEFSCSELTVWDDEIQGCNHPWAVKRSKCGRSMSYDDTFTSQKLEPTSTTEPTTKDTTLNNEELGKNSNKTIQQQLQISHGSQATQTQTQISNNPDVVQNQTQINYGDRVQNKTNSKPKQSQTQISNGSAVSQTQTQIDYGNKGMQTQLQIDHSKNSSQSQVQIVDSSTQSAASTPANNNGKNECSESGFIGDTHDCNKFYRCVNNGKGYTRYEFTCGDGTVWDPEIEACNHAWAVKECGAKHTSVGSITDTHITTTAKSTVYHTEYTKTTPSYPTSQVPNIDDEDDVGYGNQNNQEVTTSSTTTTKTTTTSPKSTTQKPSGVDTQCTTSGFMGDANDCKVFYRCVDNGNNGFTKYEFKCGDGTVWDPDIEACNHAWAVKSCGGSTSSSAEKEETTTKKVNTAPSENVHTTITLIQVSTQAPIQGDDYDTGYGSQNQEPSITTTSSSTTSKPEIETQGEGTSNNSICKSSGFMGDKKDCKKFYRCVDNGNGSFIKYEFTCGQGTVWDPTIDACNHAWAVEKCGGSTNINESNELETTSKSSSTTSSDGSSSISTTQVSKETDRPTTTISTTSSSTTNAGTSNKCSSSGFMGDTTDCKKFYRCVNNGDGKFTRYEFTCGEGTVWDTEIEACNYAWAVEKCGGSNGDSVSTREPQQTITQRPVLQDEEQDNGYATPNYDTPETSQSTVTGTSSSSTTAVTLSETGHCTNSGFMGDKNDCKKFYRCVDNGKGGYDRYEFQCGEGTVWDGSIEACNHAWAVKTCGTSGFSTTHFQEGTTQSSSSSNVYEDGQTQQSTEKTTTTIEAHHELEPTVGDKCTQEGFYGNSYDCKKFYRCVDNGKGGFTKYEFTCGEGTSWNHDIQGCDHISPDRSCSSSSTSYVTTTQLSTHLNDDMEGQTSSTSKTTTSTEEIESDSIKTTKKPESSNATCNSEGFYANLSDCKKFYRCAANGDNSYTKYDFSCGDGTVWNQEIQACDHESSHKSCSGSSSAQTTESQSESSTSSSSTTKKPETTDKTESSESMGSQCTSEGFFAHPNNCKKFIRCVDNGNGGYTRYEFYCGDGTVWVQEIQACDHDNDINSCTAQLGSTTQASNTEKNPSSTSSSSTTSSTASIPLNEEYDTQTSNEPSHDETDDCASEGYFANKQDCRKFYRCVDNGKGGYTKYDFVCGEGTAWDSDLQTCNHINVVQSCSGFTQAGNGNQQTTTRKNQAESDGTSSTTKATTSAGSTESSNSKDTCESEGYFGDSKNCKKFYRCVDNGKGGYTKYDYTCGEGTIWDQDITTCNHPQDVSNPSCGSSQGSSDTSSTTSSTTSTSQATSSTTEDSSSSQSTSDSSQEPSKKPANSNVTCDEAGYYANPDDCKKFYRCVDWDGDGKRFSVFHFECGEGTIWDPALDTCNHEDSVYPQRDCNQTQSQNDGGETATTEGSTTTTTTTTSTTSEQTTQESTTAQPTTSELTTTEQTTTTQESTTSEQTTTQQTTTTEKTTTQESTTSEQTTTQQATTSEQTTTQQITTSEQTTTQQSTTSEPTTTQQSTTSEPTTTQQSTTSEPTTTQQSTTSEPTTTQQSTTSDQTTTQQSTTSEQTTTQQSTTSEPTTTQQSTTSEPTTTQQSTTSEPTTTQQSTTSEQTTTQQSTTSEPTTTQQSTTSEPTTTQQSTTSEPTTTQQSTTSDQTTTQQSTTSEPTTTQQSTTSDQTTTQQSTTSEPTTTQQPTTSEQTTAQQSTSEQTTEQTTTSEQTTTQQPATSEQTTTQQSTTSEPTTTQQPTTSEQTTAQQSTSEQTTEQTTTSEQTTTQQPATSEQTTTQQSTTSEQTTTQQSTTEQTTTQESSSESTTQESSTSEQTTTQESTTSEQTTTQQSTTTDQTTIQESATTEQTTTESSEQTTTQQSTTSEQTTTEQSNESTTEQSSTTTEQTTDGTTTTDNTTDGTTTEETTDQSTTQSSSTESESTEGLPSTTEASPTDKECPVTEDDQYLLVCPTSFRRHPKYCNTFYQCTEDDETYEAKVAMFKCPNNTIYDESQIQCVTEDKADKKCDGEIANKRRFKRLGSNYRELIEADKGKQSCSGTGYFPFEKKSECAKGFLKCGISKSGELRGFVYQCPDGYIYWSISKRCERIENVRDCKRSSNDWTKRWNIPVERKNVAYS